MATPRNLHGATPLAPLLQIDGLAVPGGRIDLVADAGDILLVDGVDALAAWRTLAVASGCAFGGPGRCRLAGIDTMALGNEQRTGLRARQVARSMRVDRLDADRTLLDNVVDAATDRGIDAAAARRAALLALESLSMLGDRECRAGELSPKEQRLGVLACALASGAPLLVIEWPELDLGLAEIAGLRQALWLAAHGGGRAVLMATTHPALRSLAQRRVAPVGPSPLPQAA